MWSGSSFVGAEERERSNYRGAYGQFGTMDGFTPLYSRSRTGMELRDASVRGLLPMEQNGMTVVQNKVSPRSVHIALNSPTGVIFDRKYFQFQRQTKMRPSERTGEALFLHPNSSLTETKLCASCSRRESSSGLTNIREPTK